MKIAKQKEVLHVKLSQMKRLKFKVANSQYKKFGVASLADANKGKGQDEIPKSDKGKLEKFWKGIIGVESDYSGRTDTLKGGKKATVLKKGQNSQEYLA